jgi:electron transfer flavoprotein beta subunit
MPYDCIVLAKQVPDTKNITGQAMKDDGTVNRAALPAIFNPEDLNALEMALQIRDKHGGTVTIVTMGPPSAAELLRQALYRGADRVILLTDRRFAASDTLATSYALSCAVRKVDRYDLILCGRQAIDGDTAQVGPQTAEKLGLPQVTYVEEIRKLGDGTIEVQRDIGAGYEVIRADLPVLLTVTGSANEPRPSSAKRMMQYKRSSCAAEIASRYRRENEEADEEAIQRHVGKTVADLEAKQCVLTEWTADDVEADPEKVGLSGSPTKVKKIESIVLAGGESVKIEPTEDGIKKLVHELVEDHILG